MSKAFISQVIQNSADLTGTAANRAATDLMAAIVKELKKTGRFTLQDQGTKRSQPADRRVDQGEGGQDGAVQGLADAEEGGVGWAVGRKAFFFEEKKQKTFVHWHRGKIMKSFLVLFFKKERLPSDCWSDVDVLY
jgi:hypothetical protein